jgi:hypothetical protein
MPAGAFIPESPRVSKNGTPEEWAAKAAAGIPTTQSPTNVVQIRKPARAYTPPSEEEKATFSALLAQLLESDLPWVSAPDAKPYGKDLKPTPSASVHTSALGTGKLRHDTAGGRGSCAPGSRADRDLRRCIRGAASPDRIGHQVLSPPPGRVTLPEPCAGVNRPAHSLPNADSLAGFLESLAACLPSVACSAIGGKCCTCAAFTLDTRHSAHRSQAIARPSCWRQRPNTRNPRRRLWRCDGTLLGPSRTRDEAAIAYGNRSPSSPAREATPPLGAS